MAMAVADEVTEQYAAAMEEAIASATNAEAARDAALARVTDNVITQMPRQTIS